ncbi:hypothetical protein MMC07_008517 [Pseudocyphellaria aurata]|nr:hypothetical protein [Pseudocyphellaria aurata]
MSQSYVLQDSDLDPGLDGDDFPAVRAAASAKPLFLNNLLSHGWTKSPLYNSNPQNILASRYGPNAFMDGVIDGLYDSPLLRAIKYHRQANVELLLRAGADPNGQHIRFLPSPIRRPIDEIPSRNLTRFWAEPGFPSRPPAAPNMVMTALERAAREGLVEAFDAVLSKSPDVSFWISPQPAEMPSPPPHSALSPSSPLHAAVEERHEIMLSHLLTLGFSPNTIPALASESRSVTPLMASIAYCDPPNLEAYDILTAHSATDVSLRTPRYATHTLHFAAAHLSVGLLQHLAAATPLADAGTTALGHTLLHIICLPLDDTHLNVFARSVFRSVHHVRTLSPAWRPTRLEATCPRLRRPGLPSSPIQANMEAPLFSTPQSALLFAAQLEVAIYVLDHTSSSMISAIDGLGNSALHYLAAYQTPNQDLIEYLRGREEQESVDSNTWKEARNAWGYTAEDLWQDSQVAVKGRHMAFWHNGGSGDDRVEGGMEDKNPCWGCWNLGGGARTGAT